MRIQRKREHINHVIETPLGNADFADIRILHNCLPGTNADIDVTSTMAGFTLAAPFFLNAITGGAPEVVNINKMLALLCRHFGIPMAVGSQKAALDDASLEKTYTVVRDSYPEGLVFANLGAGCSPEEARRAVDMIRADALQIHLNAPQELVMREGDRVFDSWNRNIGKICAALEVPVLVKETGFGMAAEQVELLAGAGVRAVDVSGRGGTNFIAVEAKRRGRTAGELEDWGIPTSLALLEALETAGERMDIMASGGINTPLNIIKSLALGASAVGLAALPLQLVTNQGLEGAITHFGGILENIKTYMALLGAKRVRDLTRVPLVIGGETYRWLKSRGFHPEEYARRDFRSLSSP